MHVSVARVDKRISLTVPCVLIPDIASPHDHIVLVEHADKTRVGES